MPRQKGNQSTFFKSDRIKYFSLQVISEHWSVFPSHLSSSCMLDCDISFSPSAMLLKEYEILCIHWPPLAQTVFIFNPMFNQNGSDQKKMSEKQFRAHLRIFIKRGVKQRQKDLLFEGTSGAGQKMILRAEDTNMPTSPLFLMVISICVTKESYKTVQGDKLVMQSSFYLCTPQSRN